MSDLLPLVAAALKDKVAIDAQNEIEMLRNMIKPLTSVEVTRIIENDDNNQVVLYASGCFMDGRPDGNPNLWTVDLATTARCLLSDLRKCRLCVGGGFPAVSFNNKSYTGEGDCSGHVNRRVGDKTVVSIVSKPYSTWIEMAITGWPGERHDEHFGSAEVIDYLVDHIATSFPKATVEFRHVTFVSGHIHGPLKRLLPPHRRDEALATHRELYRDRSFS